MNNDSVVITSDESSFKVKIIVDDLEVKNGPGENFITVLHIRDKSIYSINVIENEHWGKLKSGIGWIDLNYTVRV